MEYELQLDWFPRGKHHLVELGLGADLGRFAARQLQAQKCQVLL
jgi:hypothetical protein